jgi:hypothetical protein
MEAVNGATTKAAIATNRFNRLLVRSFFDGFTEQTVWFRKGVKAEHCGTLSFVIGASV